MARQREEGCQKADRTEKGRIPDEVVAVAGMLLGDS